MFEFMFEFELVFIFELDFELDMFVFDIGVDIGVETGVDIGVARFVFTRLVLLAVLFDVESPQAIPKAATDNIVVSAILFIKVIDLPSSQGWKYLVIDCAKSHSDHSEYGGLSEQAPL
jgi:hypothetical protein